MSIEEENWRLLEAAADGSVAEVTQLLNSGAEVNCTTDDGWTPLLEAAIHGADLTHLLLARGADPNIASEHGYTPLHRAAGHGNDDVVRLLLDAGADVSATDEQGQTAHDMALAEGHFETAELLARKRSELSRRAGRNRVRLEGGYAGVMMFAPPSSTDYHLVCVEFEDGTTLRDAKVYDKCELELPPSCIGKKIKTLSVNLHQP